MKSRSNRYILLLLALACTFVAANAVNNDTDTLGNMPGKWKNAEWRAGAEFSPTHVAATNRFVEGDNLLDRKIGTSLAGAIRADFSFNRQSREGILYKGLYQGVGLGATSFLSGHSLLGSPVSFYVYQGAPIAGFSKRIWLGYEWQFGAAMGWKHDGSQHLMNPSPVSTAVTAQLGLGVKIHYAISDRWEVSAGIAATHFSNGNTSWPNRGVNVIGASIGVAYTINPQPSSPTPTDVTELEREADRGRWTWDVVAYGAWRKRAVMAGDPPEGILCPGKFGILGVQVSPLRHINRYVAVGPGLEIQWDEGASLGEKYWIPGTYGEEIKFRRPSFGKQLSVGVSAHAELTMPIFAVNAGLGYDIISPKGDKAFYQSLTLKAFVSKKIFLNVGYRLANFENPRNLMLGVGVRL